MANKGASLIGGQFLGVNDMLVSSDGRFAACLPGDGNLVLCLDQDLSRTYWSIESDAKSRLKRQPQGGQYIALMQGDGNFVLYEGSDPANRQPYWASDTNQSPTSFQLDLQNDGNLVVYRLEAGGAMTAVWDSGTWWAGGQVPNGSTLIRFFDFRVADSPGADTRPWQQRCRIVYSLYGPTMEDVPVPIAQFAAAHPQEIVFIYFSTIQDTEMNAASWAGLAAYVKGLFGTRLATTDLGAGATPNQMWVRHQQVIAIWEDPTTADSTLWSKNVFLDKNWYGPDNPTTAGLKDTLQTWLATNDHTKFTLTACAIGATTNMVLEGQLNPLNSATSLKDIAQGVTPAAAGWVRDDWTQLLLNAVSCDFFELAPWVGTIVERNLTA